MPRSPRIPLLRFGARRFAPALAAFLWCGAVCAEDGLAVVRQVIDGDTVILDGGERVRLLGIDAPEGKRVRKLKGGKKRLVPAQPFFIEAKRHLRDLTAGKQVKITVGEPAVGYYGRTLAYLHLAGGASAGADVQQELLRRGYAMVTSYPPNIRHLRTYAKTEAEACRAGRGIWGHPHFALQVLKDGAEIRNGRGRVEGVVTSVARTDVDIRVALNERLTLLIARGAWRRFWRGQEAESMIGERLIARGKIRASGKKKTMRIRHPFMLRTRPCEAWPAGA